MLATNLGITDTYNRFHNADKTDSDISELRKLQIEMDQAVAAAYGWTDLALGHDFHETKRGLRFTINDTARREVLQRLLKLNHERYAEEERQGLHGTQSKSTTTRGRGRRANSEPSSPTLFGEDDEEPGPADSGIVQGTAKNTANRTRIPSPKIDEVASRPTPIEEIETNDIMAAFRQAVRGRGLLDRDELLKEVSMILGFQRLGPKIEEALRGQMRAAIRRRIIEADGPSLVRAGATTMAEYDLEELRETFRSVMRKGTNYEREDVIRFLASYLGFARITETSREAIKSAINSAIRQGILGYQGSVIWREE
jgi:hypothetical protein